MQVAPESSRQMQESYPKLPPIGLTNKRLLPLTRARAWVGQRPDAMTLAFSSEPCLLLTLPGMRHLSALSGATSHPMNNKRDGSDPATAPAAGHSRTRSALRIEVTPQSLNEFSKGHLPELAGVEVIALDADGLRSRMVLRKELMAPNGFLHAASVIALADTSCGYGCIAFMPEGAKGFTTIELKSNFLGTVRAGAVTCAATPVHLGRNTQVWDAVVHGEAGGKRIALFRCTQMVLW